MPQVGGGAVAVIGEGLYDYRHARRAVALVDDLLIFAAVVSAGGLFDDTVDVVVGYVVGLGLGDNIPQLGVIVGVGPAGLDGHGQFPADLGEDLGPLLVGFLLFALDGAPFRMSRHNRFALSVG